MNLRNVLILGFSTHPFVTAINLLVLAGLGILLGHGLFDAPLEDHLVMGAMTPGLVLLVTAAILKEKRAHRHS